MGILTNFKGAFYNNMIDSCINANKILIISWIKFREIPCTKSLCNIYFYSVKERVIIRKTKTYFLFFNQLILSFTREKERLARKLIRDETVSLLSTTLKMKIAPICLH